MLFQTLNVRENLVSDWSVTFMQNGVLALLRNSYSEVSLPRSKTPRLGGLVD
jgi:hypothetical protein